MPSLAPNDSSASLVVKSNNEAAVERAIRRWAERIGARRPEVRRIVWFGSRVHGTPAPGSDVDVCLILAQSATPFRERAADYLPLGFPVGLDLFPYTVDELEQLRCDHPSWHRAITAGVDLLPESR
jgi:UTP:GlnB (protein PII) uridylyltransferase